MQTDKLELVAHLDHDTTIKTLDELFVSNSPELQDLLKRMLTIDPSKRITVQQALEHPFFAEFHDPDDEPVADRLLPFDFNFDDYDLTAEQLKDLLYEEVMLYHDDSLLEKYIEDRIKFPQGCLGERFGLEPGSTGQGAQAAAQQQSPAAGSNATAQ